MKKKFKRAIIQDETWSKQVLVIIMITLVAFCFCIVKSGYFLDEIYSFGLSNSEYKPFLLDVMDGDITEKVITYKDFFYYVAVGENRFNYDSVYYNQTQDVHPPLYYDILHTFCSLFPGSFSKWLGLIPNMIFYVLTLFLLLVIANKLFGGETDISLSVVVLYGLSSAGVETLLFVRMYMLMTLLTVLLAFIVLEFLRQDRFYLYPVVFIVLFMGLMTQYYFVFYASFICLFYIRYQWKRKQYKKVFRFLIFSLLGIGSLYLFFPSCVLQMTKGTGDGATAWQHLLAFDEYPSRFWQLFKQTGYALFLTGIFGGGGMCCLDIKP